MNDKSITIIDEEGEGSFDHLRATIDESEKLKIEGHSQMKSSSAIIGGDGEYEYFIEIEKDVQDNLLLLLLKEVFSSKKDIKEWLEEKKIPHKFSNYF